MANVPRGGKKEMIKDKEFMGRGGVSLSIYDLQLVIVCFRVVRVFRGLKNRRW